MSIDDELDALFDEVDGLEASGAVPPAHEPANDFFGPYQLVQPLGSGGVAQVWRTRHIHPNYGSRTLALKILHTQHGEDQRILDLFRREAYVLSLLKHPNVVETFEAGIHDEKFFIAMEDVDGKDLEFLVARCKKRRMALPTFLTVHIIAEVLKALGYAHGLKDGESRPLNLIHRDINPANVFISYSGKVKLGDFGVASITASIAKKNELAGKPGYFAPEQLNQKAVDQRADIFAVGVMLYELLSGQRMFCGKDMNETLLLNRKAKITRLNRLVPNIHPALEAITMTALSRKPEQRFSSAMEMHDALEELLLPQEVTKLATRAFIRKAFRAEYVTSLQLKRGLDGETMQSLQNRNVLLVCADPRASGALVALLKKYGAAGHVVARAESDSFHSQSYDLALIDGNDLQALQSFVPFRKRKEGRIPTVVFADALTDRTIERVVLLKPDEFIFKPFTEDGFLRSLQAVMMSRDEDDEANNVVDLEAARNQRFKKALLLASNDQARQDLETALQSEQLTTMSSGSIRDMIQVLHEGTPEIMVVEGFAVQEAEEIREAVRSVPGMLDLPCLMLDASVQQTDIQLDKMLATAPTGMNAARMVEVLTKFWSEDVIRRCYERYETKLASEIRYAGRVMDGMTLNLSRGGALLESSAQMPPLNTEIGLTIKVDARTHIDVSCRVTRVDLPQTAQGSTAHIGVAFKRMAPQHERTLLQMIHQFADARPLASAG